MYFIRGCALLVDVLYRSVCFIGGYASLEDVLCWGMCLIDGGGLMELIELTLD